MLFDHSHFINIFQKIPENSNPFSLHNSLKSKSNNQITLPEEYIQKKDVRCPICLGLVIGGSRPNSCYHVFCRFCLNKWAKTKNVCPYCRREFSFILKVNMTEDFVHFQGEYFAQY